MILCQELHQLHFYPGSLSLHIHRMNQKFITVGRKFFNRLFRYGYLCKFLPAVCHDIILSVFFPTAQIQNQMFPSYCTLQFFQILPVDHSILKYIRSNDHMTGTGIQKALCIVLPDPAADLHPTRIGFQCFYRLLSCDFIIWRSCRI